MRVDTKIGIVVRDDLAAWRRLNLTAFPAGAIATVPDVVGEPYEDASGNAYLPMFRQPVLVYEADAAAHGTAHARARGIDIAVYIDAMFGTGHDAANRATVRAVTADALPLAGFAVHGPKNPVDKTLKTLKGLRPHP